MMIKRADETVIYYIIDIDNNNFAEEWENYCHRIRRIVESKRIT